MNKVIVLVAALALSASCQQGGSKTTGQEPSYEDYCDSYNLTLNGVFANNHQEGTMTWTGGLKGQVEIAGVDYNEMTCTYVISDCENGIIKMNCQGAGYDTEVELYSPDSMKLGTTTYTRVR